MSDRNIAGSLTTGGRSDRCAAHTYLTIGQDYDSIQDYIRNVIDVRRNDDDDHTSFEETASNSTTSVGIPSIYMFYTDIQKLRGLYKPIDYGGGIQYANGLVQPLPSSRPTGLMMAPPAEALQIGLWLNGTVGCQNILNGLLQDQIQKLFHYCMVHTATTTSVSKIYLRIGYEFDNPQFGYSDAPSTYRKAFQYMIQECYALYSYHKCRNRIDFVWHSWAASLFPVNENSFTTISTTTDNTINTLDDYYPGDDYVDWVGISIFSQLYTDTTIPPHITQLGNIHNVQYACSFAQEHNKPIMIAESTPFGGMDQLHDPWQDWFVPILHLIDRYDIQMWSYIYCNWNSIPMWNNTGFGDSRLEQNHTILHLWYQHVLNNPQFHNKYDLNDADCTSTTRTASFQDHQEQSNSEAETMNKEGSAVASRRWNKHDTVQGSLSGPFERDTIDSHLFSSLGLYCSWTLLAMVLLFLVVNLVQRRAQQHNPKQRGYETLE